ncbi:MAG TPA: hypothetical protein VIJ35_19830, partial [Bradyrhizobium sp.]
GGGLMRGRNQIRAIWRYFATVFSQTKLELLKLCAGGGTGFAEWLITEQDDRAQFPGRRGYEGGRRAAKRRRKKS